MTDILNKNCIERVCMKKKLRGEFESENIRGIFKKYTKEVLFFTVTGSKSCGRSGGGGNRSSVFGILNSEHRPSRWIRHYAFPGILWGAD